MPTMAMDKEEIKRLAALARVAVTDEEAEGYAHDTNDILGYVAQINEAAVEPVGVVDDAFVQSVLRNDVVTNEPGSNKEALLTSAASSRDGFVEVKKILGGGSH